MSIRFKLTNPNTGAVTTVDAPRRGEFVKNNVVKQLQPSNADCQATLAIIKSASKLGQPGGVLA